MLSFGWNTRNSLSGTPPSKQLALGNYYIVGRPGIYPIDHSSDLANILCKKLQIPAKSITTQCYYTESLNILAR